MPPFADRRDAGRQLAALLEREIPDPRRGDPVVFGIASGGIVVAYEVALALDAPLAPLVVTRIRHPQWPEYALGAVGPGGITGLSPEADGLDGLVAKAVEAARREQQRREAAYPDTGVWTRVRGRPAILVDDGIATGWTVRTGLRALRAAGPAAVTLAVPVAPARAVSALAAECDAVRVVLATESFSSVGAFYLDFADVPEDAVIRLIHDAAGRANAP